MTSRLRSALAALSLTAVALAGPNEGQACCWSRAAAATTYYAPVPVVANYAPAPACNTCNYAPAVAPACNTCNYAPQVAYRTVYTNVPVTTFRPITTTNPCTGCPQTVLSPVTSFAMQPRMVPYTTFAPVNACAAPAYTASYAPAVGGCATGACGMSTAAPAATTYYAPSVPAVQAAPAASCCNSAAYSAPATTYSAPIASYSAPATTYSAPAATYSAPATTYSAPLSTTTPTLSSQSTPVPTLAPSQGSATPASQPTQQTPSTFKPEAEPSSNLKPIPDLNNSGTLNSKTSVPRLLDPHDRTTARPIPSGTARQYMTAKYVVPAAAAPAAAVEAVDDGGWRASRR